MSLLIEGMEMPKDRDACIRIAPDGEVYVYGSYPTELYNAIEVSKHKKLTIIEEEKMTTDEAIDSLRYMRQWVAEESAEEKAIDMAIKALINQQIKWGVKIEYDEGKIIAWGELQK